jgi:hypothetical protein
MKQNKTYQLGASHERQAITAYIRRRISRLPVNVEVRFELGKTLEWIERRTARFDAKTGGLGRKRRAAK